MNTLNMPVSEEISFKKTFQINIPPYLKDYHIKYFVKSVKNYAINSKKSNLRK